MTDAREGEHEKAHQNFEERLRDVARAAGMDLPVDERRVPKDKADHFRVAERAFRAGQHTDARALFREYVRRYPKDSRADYAQYYLGKSYLQQGRPAAALGEYKQVIANYRKGDVVDIEREVELGGPLHSKGVLILSSFLASRYAADTPLSLSASLVFEQSYGGIDGDSASLAETCALLSELSGIPLRQELAITGSMNQHGAAQAVSFTEDIDTGDWWVLDQAGWIHRLARGGGAVLSIVATSLTSLRLSGDLVMDPVTGDVLVTSVNRVYRVDPVGQRLSTVINLGFPQGGAEAMGLHFDQLTRGYLMTNWMGFGPGQFGFAQELDAKGQSVRSTAFGSPTTPRNVIAAAVAEIQGIHHGSSRCRSSK